MSVEEQVARTLADAVRKSARIEDWAAALSPLLNRVRAEAAAQALRGAADALDDSTEFLDPNRGVDLSYINCTRIDVKELRRRADAIEQNSEGNET